tara:strand:+ start:294 stop:653 length:360 start_codon:yes stop_codon:yes gene_type:complete
MIDILDAINAIKPDVECMVYNSYNRDKFFVIWENDNEAIAREDIIKKYDELVLNRPMRLLREERNRRLQETDWWVLPDRTASQEQTDYRQALRDLPSTSSPELDENGQLSNVTWPNKPE